MSFSVSYTQSGMERYGGGIGTVWGRYGNGMAKDWSCGMGAVWDGWVWYMGAVWEQCWNGGMESGVKRYGTKGADDALSGIFFKI